MDPIPVPLPLSSFLPTHRFPVGVLPTSLQAFVREEARRLGCAPDLVAVPLLVVAGVALGNAWMVRRANGSRASATLFAALVGPPGVGKAAAIRTVVAPLVEEQMRLVEEQRKRAEPFAFFPPGILPEQRPTDRLLARTMSPALLSQCGRGFLVVVESCAALLRQPRRARERAAFGDAWQAEQWIVEPEHDHQALGVVRCPVVGLLGMLRPAALRKIEGEESGLAEQLLFAFPEPGAEGAQGGPVREEARSAWESALRRLLEERQRATVLEMAMEDGEHEGRQASVGDGSEAVRASWANLRDYVARLALVVQGLRWACGETTKREMESPSVEAALQLRDYFAVQACRVYGVAQIDRRQAGAERIARWLTDHPEQERFRRRDVYRHLHRQFARPEDLDGPLTLLEELGYLRRTRVAGAGRPTFEWVVEEGWQQVSPGCHRDGDKSPDGKPVEEKEFAG